MAPPSDAGSNAPICGFLTAERRAAAQKAILEAALDAIVTIDRQGRIVEFNPAAERVFGRQRL